MLELFTIFVVVLLFFKYLMSCSIYMGDLIRFRDSREFYHVLKILDIYMCWKCMENFRVFTSSHVIELPRTLWNWAKLALVHLCWLSSPKLWAQLS